MIESMERGEGEADPCEVETTASGNTNRPPPPKHKNSESVSARDSTGRRTVAARAGEAASLEIAETVGALARELFVLFVDERRSHLGREGHRTAVYRRLACGDPGAVVMDGRCLLTEEAHEEEIAIARRQRRALEVPQ